MTDFRDKVSIDDVVVVRETPKALLVRFDDGEERWIPQSQVDDDSEVYKDGDEGTIIISEWWASKEGIS